MCTAVPAVPAVRQVVDEFAYASAVTHPQQGEPHTFAFKEVSRAALGLRCKRRGWACFLLPPSTLHPSHPAPCAPAAPPQVFLPWVALYMAAYFFQGGRCLYFFCIVLAVLSIDRHVLRPMPPTPTPAHLNPNPLLPSYNACLEQRRRRGGPHLQPALLPVDTHLPELVPARGALLALPSCTSLAALLLCHLQTAPCKCTFLSHIRRRATLDTFSHVLGLDLQFHLHRKTGELLRVMDRGGEPWREGRLWVAAFRGWGES